MEVEGFPRFQMPDGFNGVWPSCIAEVIDSGAVKREIGVELFGADGNCGIFRNSHCGRLVHQRGSSMSMMPFHWEGFTTGFNLLIQPLYSVRGCSNFVVMVDSTLV